MDIHSEIERLKKEGDLAVREADEFRAEIVRLRETVMELVITSKVAFSYINDRQDWNKMLADIHRIIELRRKGAGVIRDAQRNHKQGYIAALEELAQKALKVS